MSCYEWESGTILLPGQAEASVRKAVREPVNDLHAVNYKRARELWRKHGTELYRAAQDAKEKGTPYANFWGILDEAGETYDVMEALRAAATATAGRAPTHASVEPATVSRRDTTFHLLESTIRFEGRKLHWAVSENNHAREHAHEHPVAVALFKALAKVQWTRGSGGVLVGNDEYNRDGDEAGGGANYITRDFGPLGEQERAREMGITVEQLRGTRTRARRSLVY